MSSSVGPSPPVMITQPRFLIVKCSKPVIIVSFLSGTTKCSTISQPISLNFRLIQLAFVLRVLPDNNSFPIQSIDTFIN